MNYILVLALMIVVPLLLVFLFSHRPHRAAGPGAGANRGITPQEPSSDQPTPRADALNQPAPGYEEKLPPG